MWKRYSTFLRRPPTVTVDWQDPETGARGWLVINSLQGGAAGGGTRMRVGVTPREVIYLAKAMELKFALAGPPVGGAKAGIDFDPSDPRKPEVLGRWFRAIAPYLRECYGTAGDLNVDEATEVRPTLQRLGLDHPQEGIVRGHFGPCPEQLARIIRNLQDGVKALVPGTLGLPGEEQVTIADMVTGYGVARAIEFFYERQGQSLDGVRVKLEGFGNVGASCALYLARAGALIVGITDARRALVAPDGLDVAEVEMLMRGRVDKLIPDDPRIVEDDGHERFLDEPADVFVCAAISGSLSEDRLDRLEASGVTVLASGANDPFKEDDLGSTRVAQDADRRFTVLADILANCGMARTFSYLMEDDARPEAKTIFEIVDQTIGSTLDEILDRSTRLRVQPQIDQPTSLLAATLALGLDRVGAA